MFERLRMGIDICTETDVNDAPHCFTTEIPVYTLERQVFDPLGYPVWESLGDVPLESLDEVVDSMHYLYDGSARLLENGHVVFTIHLE